MCFGFDVSTACCLDSVFVTLFHTAVEREGGEVHKFLHTGKVPTILMSIVLVVADSPFGLCGLGC